MSPSPPTISPQLAERLKHQAQAKILERQRAGTWSGGVVAHSAWQKDPLGWIVKHLEVPEHTLRWSLNGPAYETHQWDGDRDPLVKIVQALADWRDCGCEAGTGTGKTFLAACIVYWFLACHADSIVSTVAPKEDQLLKHVWKEIGDLWSRFHRHFPQAELLTGVIRMKPQEAGKEKWAASAFVCGVGASEEVAVRAQGLHAEHMLVITEETPGIDPAIMVALYNTRTADHNLALALGNPDHQQDELHRFCFKANGEPKAGVVHVRMSALDHPNVVAGKPIIPGAIGVKRLAVRSEELGVGSRLYQSRVRGISPSEAEESLIKWEWCEAAAKRWDDPAYRIGKRALGVDVADSPTGDNAAIADWQGACLTEVVAFHVQDAEEVAERVYLEATDAENPVDPRYIGVDSVGVGASVVNPLKRKGLRVRAISGGTRATPGLDVDDRWSSADVGVGGRIVATGPTVIEAERFVDTRSQVLWRMRTDLRLGRVALPQNRSLFQDLCAASYGTRNGRIFVEPKESIIKRLRRSPDIGDAACYGNWVRPRALVSRDAKEREAKREHNKDRGLERFMAAHAKRQKAEEARFKRAFARRARGRREA